MNDNISEKNQKFDEDEQLKEAYIKKWIRNNKNLFKYIESLNINVPLDIKIDKFMYNYKYIMKINKEII